MTKSPKRTESFVKLPRILLESEAWRSLGINGRRFLDFLMLEHMRHSGQENGSLLAPRRQLEQYGIGARYISHAIDQAERLGLVDCKRGVGRHPSVYALTWLPMGDGSAPSNRWRGLTTSEGKSQLMTSQGKHLGYPKGSHNGRSDFLREVTKPQNKGIRREAPSKKGSYHEGPIGFGEEGKSVELVALLHGLSPETPNSILVSPTASPGLPRVVSITAADRSGDGSSVLEDPVTRSRA
jgi:hypothetical protein